jgi:hypothetical protein
VRKLVTASKIGPLGEWLEQRASVMIPRRGKAKLPASLSGWALRLW